MVSSYQLKRRFQEFLSPVLQTLLRLGVTPNQITVSAFLFTLGYSGWIVEGGESKACLLGLPVFCFLRMAMNALDGMLAKSARLESRLGMFLNELTDVGSDAALFLALCTRPEFPVAPMVLFVVIAMMTEVAGLAAVQAGAPRGYQGPMGKSDRTILIAVLALGGGLVGLDSSVIGSVLYLGSVLGVWTILNRVRTAIRFSA